MDYEEEILKIMREKLVMRTMDLLREIQPEFNPEQHQSIKTEFMRGLKRTRKEVLKIEIKPEHFPYLKLKEQIEYNFLKSRNKETVKEIWKVFLDEVMIKTLSPVPSITDEQKGELFDKLMKNVDLNALNEKNLSEQLKKIHTNFKDWLIQNL